MSKESADIAIKVEGLSKTFQLPHEKRTSVKSVFVNLFRRQTYEKQKALNNVSFEVKKGEFFGVVGRNGSGKSTLLKLLAGIYAPTNGSVDVKGSLVPFIELGVGFNPELTGRENVFLNGALLGIGRKQMQAMYKEIVEFAELSQFMDQKLKNYSSGMQVRLAFSIAIRAKGDILLLDEVLAVGDAAFQQKCFDYFEELKRDKKTVVLVSHDMGAVNRFCTRAIYIEQGNLVFEGGPTEIADLYTKKNVDASNEEKDKNNRGTVGSNEVSIKIAEQNGDDLPIIITYKSDHKEAMYVGISIIRDGRSVAEITIPKGVELFGNGKATYHLDASLFNPGAYEVSVVLCLLKNRQLVSICQSRPRFVIKGNDITKGAAMKLEHKWDYK